MSDTFSEFFDNLATAQVDNYDGKVLLPITVTMPDRIERFYNNLKFLGYNLEEMKPALDGTNSSLIVSCAGSGKTTFLVQKIIKEYLAGTFTEYTAVQTANGIVQQPRVAKVLVSTFLKTGAEELKLAFERQCSELNIRGVSADSFTFSTLHSEYYNILKSLGIKIEIQSDEDALSVIGKVAKAFNITCKSARSYTLSRDNLKDLQCIITYARNRIDGKPHSLMPEYGLSNALLDKVIERCKIHRKASNVYDFEDLQELVYTGIKTNPQFAAYVGSRYSYIFIDEFQDTSQIQYEILKAYMNTAKRIVAIGDDDQCIYSWRGSDNTIITQRFEADYNPEVFKFSINYRCKANILAPVISSISRNKDRHEKILRSYRPGGSVTLRYTDAVDSLLEEVKSGIASGDDIGILSRTNLDLLAPAILLELEGTVPFSVSKAIGISSYIPRQVLGCVKLLTRRYTEDFPSLFKLFLDRYKQSEASVLSEVLNTQSELSIYNIEADDLKYSCPTLYRNLLEPIRNAADKKKAYVYMLKYLRDKVYTGSSPFALRARLFCSFICDLILNHSKVKTLDIDEIDELFTDVIPARLNKRAYKKDNSDIRVKLTTVHEAKGKQWGTVIIWNDTNGVFPAVVGGRAPTQEEFEEERRLHYIAFTRAKNALVIFSSRSNPSPFLLECDFDASAEFVCKDDITEAVLPEEKPTRVAIPVASFETEFDSACADVNSPWGTDALNLMAFCSYDRNESLNRLYNYYTTYKDKLANLSVSECFEKTLGGVLQKIMEEEYENA